MIEEIAPAKLNLVLHVGPRRSDGLHELCSIFASIDLADEVAAEEAPAEPDEVICPEVEEPNLAYAAIAAFREAAGGLPPVRVAIKKRIPVAAGLGGGSADAAAVLRACNRIVGDPLEPSRLRELGAGVGSDVPSQIEPRPALVTGAGERVEPLELPSMAFVLVPIAEGVSTGSVYEEADRIGAVRTVLDPVAVREIAALPVSDLAVALENDLERPLLSLRPELLETLAAVRDTGALAARVTGSGPTVYGVYQDAAAARAAAEVLPDAIPASLRP